MAANGIRFRYRDRRPCFVPLCNECGEPIENVAEANLAITPEGDTVLFHWNCNGNGFKPWANFVDVLRELLPRQVRRGR